MRKYLYKFALIYVLFSIVGCTTYYRHTSKPSSMFKQDEADCIRTYSKEVCTQVNPSSSTSCHRNALTGGVDCFTNTNPGGTSCKIETDKRMAKNCLISKGWRETDDKGNYK
jgi:hypothetical protein